MMRKMLILRGKSGTYPDEDGNNHEYKRGALHEQAAKDYAKSRDPPYEGIVLDVSGETGPESAQTSQALIMLRGKDGDDFEALYGFSGGGYNVLWILKALKPNERDPFELIVVLGAPPTVLKDGHYVDDPKGTPQKSAFHKSSFEGAHWDLVYQAFTPDTFKTPKKVDGHMFLPEWLLTQK
jgi:hypothetical protein